MPGATVTAGRLAIAGGCLALAISAQWWGPRVLSDLAFFRVRTIQVEGAHYVPAAAIVDRLHIDTTVSVWTDPAPLVARVQTLVGLSAAAIRRQLPSTLVVRVVERTPVALAPAGPGLHVYDRSGTLLPIDPTRFDLDLPIVLRPDTATLRLLGTMRDAVPALYSEVSEVRPTPDGDLVIQLTGVRLLAAPTVTIARLASVAAVAADLTRRRARVQELDLRYRDQIVARLQ